MGLRKGQASKAFLEGKMDEYNFKNLSEEQMREISMKGVQARIEKSKARKAMKEQLEFLLSLDVKSKKAQLILKDMGIDQEEDMNNQMLLMVSLFKKGLSGDVAAIKQIADMVNGNVEENADDFKQPVINIVGVNAKQIKTKGKTKLIVKEEDDEEW